MDEPLFSVIMPTYQAEQTMVAAIDSVISQQQGNLELIIVNDGSTDSTHDIATAFANKHTYITQITSEHKGVAHARNLGLSIARGKYILFIDSDDLWLPQLMSCIKKQLSQQDAELLIFGFSLAHQRMDTLTHDYATEHTHFDTPVLSLPLSDLYVRNILNQVWNKVYLRTFLTEHQISFQNYDYGEDRLFVLDCLFHATTVSVIPDLLYRYQLINANSLVHCYTPDKYLACKLIHQKITGLITQQPYSAIEKINHMFIKSVFSCLVDIGGKKSHLSWFEKTQKAHAILQDEMVHLALKQIWCPSVAYRIVYGAFRSKNATCMIHLCNIVNLLIHLFPNASTKIKHKK